jgi:hypothetical protein
MPPAFLVKAEAGPQHFVRMLSEGGGRRFDAACGFGKLDMAARQSGLARLRMLDFDEHFPGIPDVLIACDVGNGVDGSRRAAPLQQTRDNVVRKQML